MVEKEVCVEVDEFGDCIKWKKMPDGTIVGEINKDAKTCSIAKIRELKQAMIDDKLIIRG